MDQHAPAKYSVVRADLGRDREQILALWTRHLSKGGYEERRYEWGNRENPFANGRRWLLLADGAVVGTAGMVIRRFKIDDCIVLAGRAGGFGVDREHRFLGPALMLQRAVLDDLGRDGLELIYSSSPADVIGIFTRLGYERVGDLARYVKILDVEPYLRRRMPASAAAWLAAPLNVGLDVVSRTTWRPCFPIEIRGFDDRFDDLWTRAAPHYGITTERTSRFLSWRFDKSSHPQAFKTVGVTAPGTDRLVGYAIYQMDHAHASVADLFAEDTDTALEMVLASVTRWVGCLGAASITVRCLASGMLSQVLERAGFRRRPDDKATSVVVSPRASGQRERGPGWKARWYFLGADDFWQ